MKASINNFTIKFGRQVFIVFSVNEKIKNEEVIEQIAKEMN